MHNYSLNIACQQNYVDNNESIYLNYVYEGEHGNTIHLTNNEKLFWTIFTLICSSIGIALSGAALALLILTAFLFSEWRQSYKNQLLIQFMFARFMYTSVRYFGDIQNVIKMCPISDHVVALDILTMIYSEMVVVIWMFVFSRQIYISLVKVLDFESSNIWRVSACAWFGPAILSLLLYLILYAGSTDRRYFLIYLMFIKWPVLITNAVLLILVLRSVLINNKKTENNTRIIIVMILLIFMFCFQQMLIDLCKIMFFILLVDTMSVLSTFILICNILAMYHCAFSTVFWVLGNANTRKLWMFYARGLSSKIRLSVRFSA